MPQPYSPKQNGVTAADQAAYVGFDLLQEQTRVKALRKGFVFNLMVAGRSGLGKSTLVNTLFKSSVARKKPGAPEIIPPTTQIKHCTSVLNEGGVKLNLTIIDTPGFGDQVNNENCWEPLVQYIEDQYIKYLKEEQKVDRPTHIEDTRVHCCIYFIQPSGHEMSSLDIEVLRRLDKNVNVIPVIAKADTLTMEERKSFKERIRADLSDHGVKIYPVLEFEDKEDSTLNSNIREYLPFAVVGSTVWHEHMGRKVLGRKCCYGFVEVENKSHSDFPLLRDMLIRSHMKDLIEVTSLRHYEAFRKLALSKTNKLSSGSEQTFQTLQQDDSLN